MNDLNTMLRQHAATGLQARLDTAVQNGDTDGARAISAEMAELAVRMQPPAETGPSKQAIMTALDTKAPWFGVDPKKSAKAVEFGKTMDPKKFPTAEAFADAVIKAVDEEFKPPVAARVEDGSDDEPGDDDAGKKDTPPARAAARRSDAPGDVDVRPNSRRSSGPWTKMSDAPSDVQQNINRQADKFAPKGEEARKKFIAKALESSYAAHKLKEGK